jgi:hypothetical protein
MEADMKFDDETNILSCNVCSIPKLNLSLP